jgi:hypothetical protein
MTLIIGLSGLALGGTDVPQINRGSPLGAPGYDPANTLQNETALIQNKPNDPNNIVVAHNDDTDVDGQVGSGLGISYSLDGGATWRHSHITMTGNMTFDPAVAADTSGNLYATCINDLSPNWQPPVALYIHKSNDKGASWTAGNSKVRYYGPGSTRYLDKSWLTVDTYTTSPNLNNIYVVWQEDDLVNIPLSYIYSAQLTPTSFLSTPVQVTETSRLRPYDNAPVPAIAPNGDVYVVWLDSDITIPQGQVPGTIRLRKSTNAGQTFDGPGNPGGSTTVATLTTVPKYLLGVGPYRQTSFPSIAADPTNSSNVYVVYAADPDGRTGLDDGNIYFTRSSNGGRTWSAPIVVNDDGSIQGQFQPWIDVKSNGYIDIVWVDGRNNLLTPPSTTLDIYMATSTDGGQTFQQNARVSDNSFSVLRTGGGNHWIGEYPGLDVDSSTAYIAWTGVQNDDPDIWFDTMSNPHNTTTGSAVTVVTSSNVTAAFTSVSAVGDTTMTVEGLETHPAPSGYSFIPGGSYYGYFDLSTTATYSGPIDIQYGYDPAEVGPNEANLKLFHRTDLGWEDATTSVDTANDTISGQVTSLSVFALALPAETTPPTITIGSPDAYGVYPAGDISFEFPATDEQSGVKEVAGTLDAESLPVPLPVSSPSGVQLGSGVYTLTVTAKDYVGNTSSKSILFVVYDPAAGFVTGGGWIVPVVDSALPGYGEKASFGFVSKYLKGSNLPNGNLEFQYRYKDINLRGIEMDWLVVSDNSAIFQGTGTINGQGLYTYRVDATDGDKTGGKPDHFKITIWQGEDIEAEPIHRYQGDLAGGSIIVHKK